MIIETERLKLRPFKTEDAKDLFEYLKEPLVHCFASMKINTIEEAEKEILNRIKEECIYFAVELKSEKKVIGEIWVNPESDEEINKDTVFSPCWMLNKAYHGKGYAYESVYAIFDYLFKERNARRIYIYTEDYNIPCQKLCKKLGMRQEALYKEFISFINDREGSPIYENTYEFAILKKEWK
ncbi:MAG: GNAT family N-acetyltransferase [Abditibacteriota bacterium]|nr:GNAT family N-acetyltransferase [Abditibacteriota bacterium]